MLWLWLCRLLKMSIYTKTGDRGTTAVFGARRVSKADPQVEAYGKIDELTSFLGLLIVKLQDQDQKQTLILTDIQKDLYEIMAVLSGAKKDILYLEKKVVIFEQYIDKIESVLPPLHRFILPGGTELSALFHIVRTICRSAEREVVRYRADQFLIIKYLNRLSDLFFDMARMYNKNHEIKT